MEFSVNKKDLADAVRSVSKVIGHRSSLPVLAGILATLSESKLTLRAGNGEVSVETAVEVDGRADGTTVMPGRLFTDVLSSLPGDDVEVTVTDRTAKIVSGRSEFNLQLIDAAEYPKAIEVTGTPVTVNADELSAALHQVLPAASSDASRPILTGVLVEPDGNGIRVVATDSYRLAYRSVPGIAGLAGDKPVIVPAATFTEAVRLFPAGEIEVICSERSIVFRNDEVTLTSTLIEGDYPPYRRLVPESFTVNATFDRDELFQATSRAKILAEGSRPVKVVLAEGMASIMIGANDQGSSTEELDVSYDGDPFTTAFNPDFLIGGLRSMSGDTVEMRAIEPLKPVVLVDPEDSSFLYLLMPVRI